MVRIVRRLTSLALLDFRGGQDLSAVAIPSLAERWQSPRHVGWSLDSHGIEFDRFAQDHGKTPHLIGIRDPELAAVVGPGSRGITQLEPVSAPRDQLSRTAGNSRKSWRIARGS